jgi:hypothetical protein
MEQLFGYILVPFPVIILGVFIALVLLTPFFLLFRIRRDASGLREDTTAPIDREVAKSRRSNAMRGGSDAVKVKRGKLIGIRGPLDRLNDTLATLEEGNAVKLHRNGLGEPEDKSFPIERKTSSDLERDLRKLNKYMSVSVALLTEINHGLESAGLRPLTDKPAGWKDPVLIAIATSVFVLLLYLSLMT